MGRALREAGRKAERILRLLDHGPGDDDLLIRGTGPFDIHDCNTAQHAFADGVMDLRGSECLNEALPLEVLLVRLHGQGDIHRQHERQIDLGLRLCAPRS
jgi:hypothetical protein